MSYFFFLILVLNSFVLGLYQKAIAQSGCALCNFSFTVKHKERAFALGKLLGFETDNEKELLNYFLTVPAVEFAKHQDEVMTMMASTITYYKNLCSFILCRSCH